MSSRLIECRLKRATGVICSNNPFVRTVIDTIYLERVRNLRIMRKIFFSGRFPWSIRVVYLWKCGGSGGRNRTLSNTIHFQKFIGVPPHLHTTTHIPFGKRREADASAREVAIGSM
jgi:hypothetical protein